MYFVIGASLLFAYLYAVNLAASFVSTVVWRLLPKQFVPQSSRRVANTIFLLRVLPITAAVVFVIAFIIPSFLMFEPEDSGETFGAKLAIVVGISAFGMLAAAARVFISWRRTTRLTKEWMLNATPVEIEGVDLPSFKMRHPFPVIAVVGVFNAKLFVAEQIFDLLTKDELSAAMIHEAGHIAARDNLKRVLMRTCGDLLILPLGKSLDRRWSEAVETAADEFVATRGGKRSALDLASALIKIGRVTPVENTRAVASAAFLIDPKDASLAARIDRLINLADAADESPVILPANSKTGWLLPVVVISLVLFFAVNEAVLIEIHEVSEMLIAALQ